MKFNNIILFVVLSFGTLFAEKIEFQSAGKTKIIMENNESVEALEKKLLDTDVKTRLSIIKILGILAEDNAKQVLEKHYRKIPSNSQAQQMEKVAVLKALLPNIDSELRKKYLMSFINEELNLFKDLSAINEDIYHPKILLMEAVNMLKNEGYTEEIISELSMYANDRKMSQHIREELLSCLIWYEKSKKMNLHELIRSVLADMEVRPTQVIPWNFYNEKDKRIEYCKTNWKENTWLSSEAARVNAAHEKMLERAGVIAVEEIIMCLEKKCADCDHNDYFASLASDILRKRARQGFKFNDNERELVFKLGEYVEVMQDDGAFGRRATAATNLNYVNKYLGIDKNILVNPGFFHIN